MKGRIRHQPWGISGKLIVPFVIVFVSALALMGTMFIRTQGRALSAALGTKSEVLVRNLVDALRPFSVGEVTRMDDMLESARRVDKDVIYAVLLSAEGQLLGSSAGVRKEMLGDFDAAAFRVATLTRRPATTPGAFEMVLPFTQGNAQVVLRVGVSTRQVDAVTRSAAVNMLGVGALALVAGVGIYWWVARRVARPLHQAVERLEDLASGAGDPRDLRGGRCCFPTALQRLRPALGQRPGAGLIARGDGGQP